MSIYYMSENMRVCALEILLAHIESDYGNARTLPVRN